MKQVSGMESNTVELNAAELSAGIYFLKMSSEKGTVIKKVVKE